jgi:NAD(P)-dependent dehydrogenase (short-subunit alcohol dehydrogenase family)
MATNKAPNKATNRVWFITGASRGFGLLWAEAALGRGDRVAATVRDISVLDELCASYGDALMPIRLDVTHRNEVFGAVNDAVERFGRLDVVINNAGYGHFGAVEELSEYDIRAQMETNFFGALWVLQAALPVMRAQGEGHLITVTSEGGVRAYPGIGAYHASKWALEGLTQSMAQEVRDLGIKVTNIEPGPYATGWLEVGSRHSTPQPAYDRMRQTPPKFELGDPDATTEALFAVIDADKPPLRIFFGRSFEAVHAQYTAQIAEWQQWQNVALAAFK